MNPVGVRRVSRTNDRNESVWRIRRSRVTGKDIAQSLTYFRANRTILLANRWAANRSELESEAFQGRCYEGYENRAHPHAWRHSPRDSEHRMQKVKL